MISSQRLFEELGGGNIFPAYMLLGEDRGAKDEFLQNLKTNIFKSEDGRKNNVSIFYGDEASTEEIIENLATFSFFSDKKLIIVRNFDLLQNIKPLVEYIESPNTESILVLISENKSAAKGTVNAVEKKGRACIFWPMFQNESVGWLKDRLKKLDIQAGPEAIKYIIELSGTSVNELRNQIECIANYLNRGEVLSLEKVKNIIAKLYNYTVFDLSNAIFVKKTREILEIFRYLVNNGEDLVKILYFCSRELKKLLGAFALREGGYDFYSINRTLGFRKKEAERIRSILQRISLRNLCNLYSRIAALDHTIKTSPKEISVVSFERFLTALGQ
ncbi:MAG: DNA polymerase III subunit delta [Spirochaetes bacterium]|nr:DNA polymerase III subunit delta [Spirochaetota bacterium]